MHELDIDLSDRHPQPLTRELAQQADIVVTMGCGDTCPYIPGRRYIDWDADVPDHTSSGCCAGGGFLHRLCGRSPA